MPKKGQKPVAIDLFAGCGGLTSGLIAAGFNVRAAVEIDPDAAASYRANHPGIKLYETDIRKLDPIAVRKALRLPRGRTVDLIAGCPPCQGFTRLTESKHRREQRNALVRDYFRFVQAIKPKVCMLENVPGLMNTKKGRRYFDKLVEGLERLGYKLNYDVLELADYGVPQFRKRLVLLASRGKCIPMPEPTHRAPTDTASSGLPTWKTVRQAIGRLPEPPLRSEVISKQATTALPWHYARDVAAIVRRRLEHAQKSGKGRRALPKELRLECHQRRPDGYFDVYGVMSWDSPSPTITSGCTNASKGKFGHPSAPRPITAAEAARLQTFPHDFRFEGCGLESVAAQIGNALPRRFAAVVGRSVMRHLYGEV